LQAVFIDNVKVASTKMRQVFSTMFRTTWYKSRKQVQRHILGEPIPVQLTQDVKRTHAADLTPEILNHWTFFSFVREPISRFASSHAQAVVQGLANTNDTWATQQGTKKKGRKSSTQHVPNKSFLEVVDSLERGIYLNEHYQSQLWRLTPSHQSDGPTVPMHFIGRLETFADSWDELLDLIAKRSAANPSSYTVPQAVLDKTRRLMAGERKANSKQSSKFMKAELLESTELIRRVERLYSMDFDCFGFTRKYERAEGDAARGLESGEYNWRKSYWHMFPGDWYDDIPHAPCTQLSETRAKCADPTLVPTVN
jgi:hypothetical protein